MLVDVGPRVDALAAKFRLRYTEYGLKLLRPGLSSKVWDWFWFHGTSMTEAITERHQSATAPT